MEEDADRFRRNITEYYFYSPRLNYYLATQLCINRYKGHLVWIRDMELAEFLAEALSETRLEMDTLWTAGRRDSEEAPWEWRHLEAKEKIKEAMTEGIVTISEVEASDRHCLGFGRKDHDIPEFRALACGVERSVLCETKSLPAGGNGSTHPGWITLGKYEYKIFHNLVNWQDSNAQCNSFNSKVRLASVFTFDIAEQLGRYLLIGRPSLENAWIGAKWDKDSYVWLETGKILNSTMDLQSNYPPWKGDMVQKKQGCILLDRHIADITLFVEARCERRRPYICYRDSQQSDAIKKADIIIDDYGYRVIYDKMMWDDALDYCRKYRNYQAQLVEIRNAEQMQHLLYIMGDNHTDLGHIWIGGRFRAAAEQPQSVWLWESDNATISTDESVGLRWIKNTTYDERAEEVNVCLNMDRENHKTPLHYGASCSEPQCFICIFPKSELLKLQEEERKEEVHTDPPMLPRLRHLNNLL